MKRSSGILMHISSLWNKYGIGTFGDEAYEFVDFLVESGQRYWQILPLGQTSHRDSPYQCFSVFAGNPYFIDFEYLEKDGFLEKEDYINEFYGDDPENVDYGAVYEAKYKVLNIAFDKFKHKVLVNNIEEKSFENQKKFIEGEDKENVLKVINDYEYFKEENKFWLKDYSLFMAIKGELNSIQLKDWEECLKVKDKDIINEALEELEDKIEFWNFVQFKFFEQWNKLKSYANKNKIKIIGDIPIYVAADSAEVWAHPELFQLDENLEPTGVAGCPPDSFTEEGQFWGNPLYDWEYHEKTEFKWWISRVRESFKLYDVVRIDHFRGFESYWRIPYGDDTAKNGEWVKGPGIKLFNKIKEKLGDLEIVAEDLGFLTEEVREFREETGFPGMKILIFAFGGENNDYLPHNVDENCIYYTGTHDNETVIGWYENNNLDNTKEKEKAIKYFNLTSEEGINFGMLRGIYSSRSNLVIAQIQDFLGFGDEARMNDPTNIDGNWKFRVSKGALNKKLSEKIKELTVLYNRI